jgi:hypothetical protein
MSKRTVTLLLVLVLIGASPMAAKPNEKSIAPDSELCRSQLDFLLSRGRLTAEEASRFEAQCDCLEQNEKDLENSDPRICAVAR